MKTRCLPLILAACLAAVPFAGAAEKEARPLSMANLAIPESLGKIEERFQGDSKRWIINIQDVHAHFGAQENIAAILNHLNEIYGLRLAAYEGGWNVTSYPKTWQIPSSRQKQLVLRTLMEEDLITGPAFAAMNSKMPMTLHGIEDSGLYKKNLAVYLEFLKGKEATEKQLSAIQNRLENEKTSVYNPDLLRFDRSLIKFREDSKTAAQFFPALLKQSQALGIDLDILPQLHLFHQMNELEKGIEKEKLNAEIQRLMQEHKNSRLSFEEMLRHGTFTDEKLSFYPNAQKQRDLLLLQDGLIHEALFEEIEKAVDLVKEKLFQSDAERSLDERFERLMTAKKIILFKASPADVRLYRQAKDLIEPEIAADGLEKALSLGADFYDLALERDLVFFQKVTTDPALIKEDIALVAGGFHTDGVREQLRKAGISYIVITPQLGQESPDEKLYYKQLQSLTPLLQTLSEIGNRLGDEQDERIAAAITRFQRGDFPDTRQVVAFVAAHSVAAGQAAAEEDFLALSAEEQRKAVESALQSVLSGEQPVSVVIRADALRKLLDESALAQNILRALMENDANHITVLYKSFLDIPDVISDAFDKANIKTVGETDLDRAINRQRELQQAVRQNKLAVIADDYKNQSVLVLRESPLALLLFRPLLEQGWRFAWDDPQTQTLITQMAEEILAAQGFLTSA